MSIKNNRAASFIAVSLIYVISALIGILTYIYLPFGVWLNLLIADVAATVVTFIFSLIFSNASVYDPYWSVQPPVILFAFAAGRELTTLGVLMIIVVSLWALRLTANWAYTFHGLEHQDWRYTMLRETTGKFYPIVNLIGIHMIPTVIVYACTLPAVFVIVYEVQANVASIIFCILSMLAPVLQGVADIQMHAFRKKGTKSFIRSGLWKYSRHPNYLGEILMWWGVGLAAFCAMPRHYYLLAGAIANTLLFLFISIPMADKKQSRKEGFAEYKRETRMLLPFPKFAKTNDVQPRLK